MPSAAHRLITAFLLFMLALAPGRACADEPLPLAAELDAVVLRSELGQFWGGVLVVSDGKPLLASGYGFANDSLSPINSQTLFDIGSIAKQFTAALALKLHTESRLSLDEPISTYFPGLPNSAAGITLRHLLTHTSGLSDAIGAIQSLDFPDRDEAVRLAFASRLSSIPGERFEYCNGGYCIAAAIIERAAGSPFQSLMREEIFLPAGLTNTGFLDGENLDLSNASARIISSRGSESRRSLLQDGWGWGLRGCGGILMSLDDIARWDAALRTDAVVDAAAKQQFFSPVLENYALGWHVDLTAAGNQRIWHTGGTRGYRSYLLRMPDKGIVVAVLTNDKHNPSALGDMLLATLLPEERSGISASLHIDGLKLNEYKAAVIDRDVRINVDQNVRMPDGPPTRLDVSVAVPATARQEGRIDAVKFTLQPGAACKVASDIRTMLAAKPASLKMPSGIEVTIATLRYSPVAGTIELPDDVKLTVMPRYSGVGADGKQFIDERICIVLMDETHGFWPVILKLDRIRATELADMLDPRRRPWLGPQWSAFHPRFRLASHGGAILLGESTPIRSDP